MPFEFPLEAVLRLRRGQERVERLKLEAIASELAQARRQLEFVTDQHLQSRLRFREAMREETLGSELQFEEARSERIEAARRALQIRVAQLEQERLKQVEIFVQSRQRREIVENLRERAFQTYRQARSRREQQNLNDLFLMGQGLGRNESE
jgi:flagellar protein FliJ